MLFNVTFNVSIYMRVYYLQKVPPGYTTWYEPCIRKKYTISCLFILYIFIWL